MTQASVAADRISYEDLYRRWESGNWRATELDFSVDREHWHERFDDLDRRAAMWSYSMFFHGEDSVADNLSPYIDAAPREEQKYFLATQQVDEARHAVFFARFMRDVAGRGDTIERSLAVTAPERTWGFVKTFEMLDRVADDLRRDRSRPMLAGAVTMYHLIVEATLAQPGQHFIESYLTERGVMPAFRAGMANVSQDEQRHIGFGVKLLRDLQSEDPDCRYAIADMLRDAMPYTTSVFVPPGMDRRYTEVFGKTIEELFESGMESLETKLRAAGMPVEELPGAPVVPIGLTARERAERVIALLESGVLGEKVGPPARDPETVALLFDILRRSIDTGGSATPIAIQWDFRDAPAWHLTVDNGATSAAEGRLARPDVVVHSSFEDFVDVFAGREDPRLALAKRKIRLRGGLRALWRARRVLGG